MSCVNPVMNADMRSSPTPHSFDDSLAALRVLAEYSHLSIVIFSNGKVLSHRALGLFADYIGGIRYERGKSSSHNAGAFFQNVFIDDHNRTAVGVDLYHRGQRFLR